MAKRIAWNTVHYGKKYDFKNKRYIAAQENKDIPYNIGPKDLGKCIVDYCNRNSIKTKCINYKVTPESISDNGDVSIDYEEIRMSNNLNSEKDIVWIKFANDGHVGVVASSNDINFQIPPPDKDKFDEMDDRGKWKYNSSGILIRYLGLDWDKSFVLIFPIIGRPKGDTRHKVEKKIGDHLIEKGVPILDFYSHRLGGR